MQLEGRQHRNGFSISKQSHPVRVLACHRWVKDSQMTMHYQQSQFVLLRATTVGRESDGVTSGASLTYEVTM